MREILIIGGGIIGLTLARKLHKKGFGKITIIERGNVGRESSYAAAGMLAPQAETDKIDPFFRFCVDSHKLYANFARELFEETGVDIQLDKSGTLYLAFDEADAREIRRRFDWQTKAKLEVEHLTAKEIRKAEAFVSPDVREGLFFPNDWQVENRKLLDALQIYAEINDIEIIEQTEIENLLIENGKIEAAQSKNKIFRAETVILATGAWTSLIKSGENVLASLDVKPIRGQIFSFRTAKRLFERVIYSPRGYIVPRADGRIIAGATVEDAGFDKNVTTSGIEFVRENAFEIAPSLVNLKISESWAGLRPFAKDGLPILGEFPGIENLYIAAAHYRNGILLAPITAEILANKIAENIASDYLDIFSPRRFQAVSAANGKHF